MELTVQHIQDMIDPQHEEYTPEIAELHSQIGSEIWNWFDKEADPGTINRLTERILVLIYENINN